MIHLDTNYLVGLLVKGSPQAEDVDGWPATRMELISRGTIEQRIMAAVSALTWLACLLAWWGRRFRPTPQAFPETPGSGSTGGADPLVRADPPGSALHSENRDLAARRRPDGGVRPTRHA